MSIKVLSNIEPKRPDLYKVTDGAYVGYENAKMEGVDNVSAAIDNIYGIITAEPTMEYHADYPEKQYWALDDTPIINFIYKTTIPGKYTISVTRNGIAIPIADKQRSGSGTISIQLPKATTQGLFAYEVSIVDGMGNINSLKYTFIYGGVTISSDFNNILNNKVFTVGDDLTFPISISYAEDGQRNISYFVYDSSGKEVKKGVKTLGDKDVNNETIDTEFKFTKKDLYTLKLEGNVNNALYSNKLEYSFNVLNPNSIAVSITQWPKNNPTTDDAISIGYRVITNIDELKDNNELCAILSIYKINDDLTETRIKSLTTPLTSGDIKMWNIGRISSDGNYKLKLEGGINGGSITDDIIVDSILYNLSIGKGGSSNYLNDSHLIAYFDANEMDNADKDPYIWESSKNSQYYFKLHGLNYQTNGWVTDENGQKMLSFTGDSYGEMRYKYTDDKGKLQDEAYCPMNYTNNGNTIEILFRSKCIGELGANVLTCRYGNSTASGGYILKYDNVSIATVGDENISRVISEDRWTHVCFVIDNDIRAEVIKDKVNLEDLNTFNSMKTYIDGCLSACNSIGDWKFAGNNDESSAKQLLLNAAYTGLNSFGEFGTCDIKLLRIYDKALTYTEVLGNYISSISDIEKRVAIQNKNNIDYADVPVIYFIRNKQGYIGDTAPVEKTFATLNTIQKKEGSGPTSKNSWVNCTVWYKYHDDSGNWYTEKYEDVDVYLQGTSSLKYAVKNYKIKLYKNSTIEETGEYDENGNPIILKKHGAKNKIIPPNKENDATWIVPDSTYTLKCDYMEQSHKNNTCTAIFYENLLSEIVNTDAVKNYGVNDKYSVAKQQKTTYYDANGEEITVNKFRDAINGFPVILYYNDNYINDNTIDLNETDDYGGNTQDVYAGTYMFNVDKEGKQLGFEINSGSNTPLSYTDDDGNEVVLDDITYDILPCVSFEGTTNIDTNGACGFYDYDLLSEDDKKGFSDKYAYIGATFEPRFTYVDDLEKKLEKKYRNEFMYDAEGNETNEYKTLVDEVIAKFVEEGKEYTEDDLQTAIDDAVNNIVTQIVDNIKNHVTFDKMYQTIKWVNANCNNEKKFKNEFKNYFSFTYCLAYYLQMMVFAQIDNAGKNAMFDTWGGVFYPRPYDMDTQMGFNNIGEDVIIPSAEINCYMTKEEITGDFKLFASIISGLPDADGNEYDPNKHIRFNSYNTLVSNLWNAFGTYFHEEIASTYKYLREKGIYNVDNICRLVDSYTTDIIGESFYNKDAVSKYINVNKYLFACQGNRSSRYRNFLEQRIIFLDTVYNYAKNNLNTNAGFRSAIVNVTGANTGVLGLTTYTPQYVNIRVGEECEITVYIDQDSKYNLNGTVYNGALLTLPFAGPDISVIISGAGNIKTIDHTAALYLKSYEIENCTKLNNIAITNSSMLESIKTLSNTYLRSVNLSGNRKLVSALTLAECKNLKEVDISNSAISSISLPEGAPLSLINLKNSKIGSLTLSGLQFIDNDGLNLEGCNNLTTLKISNCPNITELDISSLINLQELVIDNMPGLETLDLSSSKLNTFNITNCNNLKELKLDACSGNVLKDLNLTSLYSLEKLSLKNATCSDGIFISLPKYIKEYVDMPKDEQDNLTEEERKDYLWGESLTYIDVSGSSLKEIRYGGLKNVDDPVADMTQLTNLERTTWDNYSNTFNNCGMIQKIINFNIKGSLSETFRYCKSLTYVSGTVVDCTSLASSFYDCENIDEINLTFTDPRPTNADSIFYACFNLPVSYMNSILESNTTITSLNNAFYKCYKITGGTVAKGGMPNIACLPKLNSMYGGFLRCTNLKSIPQGYLNNNTKLTNLTYCFGDCTALESVPHSLFKNCTDLEGLRSCFTGCSALSSFFDNATNTEINQEDYSPYDILPAPVSGTNKITNISFLFSECKNLQFPTNKNGTTYSLYDFFKNAKNLTLAEGTFIGCGKLTEIPNGVLKENTKLISIIGIFKATGLESLPTNLFGNKTGTHTSLTNASGIFANCLNMTGIAYKSLFTGAENITSLGYNRSSQAIIDSAMYLYTLGIFANTKISGYASDLLSDLSSLINVSCLFAKGTLSNFKGTKDNPPTFTPSSTHSNSNVLNTTYFISEEKTVLTRWSDQLFINNTNLKYADYVFAGNTGMIGFCDENGNDTNDVQLFSKQENDEGKFVNNTVESINGMFAECCIAKEDTDGDITYIGLQTPIHNTIFKDLTALEDAKDVFMNCYGLPGKLNADIFENCLSLETTTGMFYGCSNLGIDDDSNSISISNKIFDYCRDSLIDVSYMFTQCGFAGRIGIGSAPTKDPETNEIISYDNKGLLAECTSLVSAKAMFALCKNLKGAIPQDLFYTRDLTRLYSSLNNISYLFSGCCGLGRFYGEPAVIIGGNPAVIYEDYINNDGDVEYRLIPSNWLSKCPAIADISYLFCNIASNNNIPHIKESSGFKIDDDNYRLVLDESVFSTQIYITNAKFAFANIKTLTGSISNEFMKYCLSLLKDVSFIFAKNINLESVGGTSDTAVFQLYSTSEGTNNINTALKNISYAFYRCANLTGYAPDKDKFRFNTFTGMVYNCPNITNKSIYEGTQYSQVPEELWSDYFINRCDTHTCNFSRVFN